MRRTAAKSRLTAKAFAKLAPDLGPSELERGEVITLSPGGMFHSSVSFRIAQLLGNWADDSNSGRVFVNELGIITERDPDTVRGIDVAYYARTRLGTEEIPESFTDVPPTLAVEVLGRNQSWSKLLRKAAEYLGMGVDRVWIVDGKRRRMAVIRADDEPTMLAERDAVKDAELLPGFRCRVADFFR